MNVPIRARSLPRLSLILAAAFILLQLVNLEHGHPSQWPMEVSLGFVVMFFGLAHAESRSGR